jgi:hypothetical protein
MDGCDQTNAAGLFSATHTHRHHRTFVLVKAVLELDLAQKWSTPTTMKTIVELVFAQARECANRGRESDGGVYSFWCSLWS